MTEIRHSSSREIRIRGDSNSQVAADLVQSVLAIELVRPGADLWLVSAWISDIRVVDNTGGEFSSVAPTWPMGEVLLSDYLVHLAQQGTRIRVITRAGQAHNQFFLRTLKSKSKDAGVEVSINEFEREHRKRLVTDKFVLWGSMNFTLSGVDRNLEDLQLMDDPVKISEALADMIAQYGA